MFEGILQNYPDFNAIPRRVRRQRRQGVNQNPPVPMAPVGPIADQRRAAARNIRRRGNPVVQRSPAEVTLMRLLKKRREIANPQQFRQVFEREVQRNPTDGTLAFFYDLFLTRNFDVKRLGLGTNLAKNPIVIPIYGHVQADYLTTDSVYWYKRFQEYRQGRDWTNAIDKFVSITICSLELITFPNERDITHYYVEDFDPDVCAVALNGVQNVQANELVDMNQDFTFYGTLYKTLSYNVAGPFNGVVVYAPTVMNNQGVADVINRQRFVNSKRNLIQGLRTSTENAGAYFINTKITPTTFCPAVMGGFGPTNFGFVINAQLDLNYLINYCLQVNDVPLIPNLITWDTLETAVEFFTIVLLTTNLFHNQAVNLAIYEQCRNFFEFKPLFLAMKRLYKKFERIVLLYIDSFKVRASIDRMRLIKSKCDEYMQLNNEIWQNRDVYTTVREFVGVFGDACAIMGNFFLIEPSNVILIIKEACSSVDDTTMAIDALDQKLRGAAYMCYRLLVFGEQNCVIPTCRSPSCFLGNLRGDHNPMALMDFITALRNQAMDRLRNVGAVWIPMNFNIALAQGNVANNIAGLNQLLNFDQRMIGLIGINNQNDLQRLFALFPQQRRNEIGLQTFANLNARAIASDANARGQFLVLRRQIFPNIDQIVAAGYAIADGDMDQAHNAYMQMRNAQDQMRRLGAAQGGQGPGPGGQGPGPGGQGPGPGGQGPGPGGQGPGPGPGPGPGQGGPPQNPPQNQQNQQPNPQQPNPQQPNQQQNQG